MEKGLKKIKETAYLFDYYLTVLKLAQYVLPVLQVTILNGSDLTTMVNISGEQVS